MFDSEITDFCYFLVFCESHCDCVQLSTGTSDLAYYSLRRTVVTVLMKDESRLLR